MNYSEFLKNITKDRQAQPVNPLLEAVWHLKNNHWQKSHDIVENSNSEDAAWIHGLLHKQEGDEWNAGYWYSKAGINSPKVSLEVELEMIIEKLMG